MTALAKIHRIAARLARTDFHSFVEYVGADDDGMPMKQRPHDRLVWDFVEETHAAGFPAGVMLPMSFGKTTQFCYRAAFEIGRNPNLLASIVTDSVDNSKERVALIRKIIDKPEYRRVFPHVRVLEGHDERSRFTIERNGLSKDPTCSGSGVLTGTGTRTNFLLMDDVVTLRNAIQEPQSRRATLEAVRTTWMSRTKIHSDKTIRIAWIQTAYHMSDAAATLREEVDSGWRWLVVRAEEPYEVLTWERWERGVIVETGTVACPFPPEKVRARAQQMGPTAAARGLANRPVSGQECVFQPEHFKGPEPGTRHDYPNRILFADPAGDATKLRVGDPDWCAVVVIGWHPKDRVWDVLAADRMRGSPSQQAEFIAGRACAWSMSVVYQEAVKDEALVEVTQQKLRDKGASISVRPEKPTTNKELRITQVLEPALAAGTLRVCGDRFPELRNEALAFPAGSHDDLLDALAGAFAKAPRYVAEPGSGRPWPRRRRRSMFDEVFPNPPDTRDMVPGSELKHRWWQRD